MPTSSRSTSFTSYMLRALYLTVAICALFPLFILCYVSSAAFQSLLIHMHFVNFPFPFLTDFTKSTEPQWLSPALPCAAYIHTASNYSSASTPRSQLAGWLLSPASRCPSTSSLSTHLPASAASDTRCSSAAPFVHPILYLHGNAENRAYRPSHDRYNFFTAFPLCADVFVFDYSGFGENSGWPTQQLIVEDAHVMLDSVNHWPGVDPSAVIVFGHSLGSAVAVQLLSSITRGNSTRYSGHRPAGLIVEGAFTNVADNAMDMLPSPLCDISFVHRLVEQYTAHPYKSDELIPLPAVPTVWLHGKRDDVIRHWNADKLWNRTVASRGCKVDVERSETGEVQRCGTSDVLVSINEATHYNSITYDIAQQAVIRFVQDIDNRTDRTAGKQR